MRLRLLIFASVVTLALNVADPLLAGEYGKAAFDATARWPQLLRYCTRQGQVPTAEEQPEDRKVNCWNHQRRDPDWHAEPEREVEDVAEAEEEREADDAHGHGDGLNHDSPVRI